MWFRIDLHCLNNHIKHTSDRTNVIKLERSEFGNIKGNMGKIWRNISTWGHPKAYSNPDSDPEQRPYVMISGYFHPFRFTIRKFKRKIKGKELWSTLCRLIWFNIKGTRIKLSTWCSFFSYDWRGMKFNVYETVSGRYVCIFLTVVGWYEPLVTMNDYGTNLILT